MRYHKANGEEVIVYTNEEKARALEVSLVSLASSLGYTPVRQGIHYSLKEMDSLVIYNDRTWNRWSGKGNRTGGTQIDFLLEFGGADNVPEAIQQLLEFKGEAIEDIYVEDAKKESGNRKFELPAKNSNFRRLYAYLIKTRGLSQDIVTFFVHNKLIYEDAAHHNIVYCGYDPEGNIRYAGMRGTADLYGKKFKMDVPGNDKNYGVNIVNPSSNELKVFESVIDCMSYMDMYKDYESNKLILGMVEDNPLEQFLKDYSHIEKIVFCLDNDAAGQQAIYEAKIRSDGQRKPGLKEKYEERGYEVGVEVPAQGKDFNECLLLSQKKTIVQKDKLTNSLYVEKFYDQMMKIVGYVRGTISEPERIVTVKYVNPMAQSKYLSDGYGDCYAWIRDNNEIPNNQKTEAAKLNQAIRKICMVQNQQGDVGFYMENTPEEKYILYNSGVMKYPSEMRYKLYHDFDGLLTAREMDKLSSICDYLEKKLAASERVSQNTYKRNCHR